MKNHTKLETQVWSAMDQSPEECTIVELFHALAGKWTLPVLYYINLSEVPLRFGEIRRRVDGITTSELTKVLRHLEAKQIVFRRQFNEIPVRVEYSPTPLGASLSDLLRGFNTWLQSHQPEAFVLKHRIEKAESDRAAND